ncbi:ATP-dependent (S)-NAD(P)H-hydrate dehydratase [Rubripirellula obstinata]|uniref:ADP-dependent (S)-NAD(P)H-hydrate dehydratase n=1 Tax=Rubripirellula obstinata TaxID=406547 RepID=A0A5B1CM93_9BACT|nr:NAD(P)H-hydrate dehydratase [Rubripirellula obstinata]KAA1260473.1 ATP-dependent (S)-NAD(P)H-hydrate dehydratase [Rubripirellula obstinata]
MSPALPISQTNSQPNSQPPFPIPSRDADAHKGTFGRVLLIGGSRGMAGSIAMSAIAAMKSGSGLVSVAVPDPCLETVASFHPAMMTIPISDDGGGCFGSNAASELLPKLESVDAIAVGPGMTTGPGAKQIVEDLIDSAGRPMVLDADAINCLAAKEDSNQVRLNRVVLTPHPGELQRLTGVSSGQRDAQIAAASKFAKETAATIVVKGGPTVVVDGQQTYVNETGNPGMATGGSGDVLTGVITSLLGQGLSPWEASCQGVWVHGLAGDIAATQCGEISMTAMEIISSLSSAFQQSSPP